MTTANCYLMSELPEGLEGLTELALDLRWAWHHGVDKIWCRIDKELWELTRNAWFILHTISADRLRALAQDSEFVELVRSECESHRQLILSDRWFQEQPYCHDLTRIAYFSMEFGLSEALPIYSGGLGMLAGDHLKTAHDLGVPVVGVGLLYQQGFARQVVAEDGSQQTVYLFNDPGQIPVMPVRNQTGDWLCVDIPLPGRILRLRPWLAQVGAVNLYLLDSNDPVNSPSDRGITGQLYGGSEETRLLQEMVLGIGGWRLLTALGVTPQVCHLNEGHAAFVTLERAHQFAQQSGQSFSVAWWATRVGNVFTTHTPISAGFDRFSPVLMARNLSAYTTELGLSMDELLALGRLNPGDSNEPFNMAYLAIRGSAAVNGVSRLHGEVSRRLFQPLFPRWPTAEVPVEHVTNGVHMGTWDSVEADKLWTKSCGKTRWDNSLETIGEHLCQASDMALWEMRAANRRYFVEYVRYRNARQLGAAAASREAVEMASQVLDPNVLTLGFARRFTAYKRPDLLLRDPERLIRLLTDLNRPVQLVIAGKAHPEDGPGKTMVQAWVQFLRRPELRLHGVFLADYDLLLAEQMVQGVDVWINTPRRTWEACGTSGMKVLVNGGLNISVRDGWWAEAYRSEVGWCIGDDSDDGRAMEDHQDVEDLYRILEEEVIPDFYRRDAQGLPGQWLARIRASMSELTPQFSANRMLREYVENYYVPAAKQVLARTIDSGKLAEELRCWQQALLVHWTRLHFGTMDVVASQGVYRLHLPVYLDELEPDFVRVQLCADASVDGPAERHEMRRGMALRGAVNGFTYDAEITTHRPVSDFTPRIIPYHPAARIPLETNAILWAS